MPKVSSTNVSQSIEPATSTPVSSCEDLQAQIDTLNGQIKLITETLERMAINHVELSQDMGTIYNSLESIAKSVADPIDNYLAFPLDDDDDKLLN